MSEEQWKKLVGSVNNMPKNKTWIEELKTKIGGYCYFMDGGAGGYDWNDIEQFIQKQIDQAREEEKKRIIDLVVQEEKKMISNDYNDDIKTGAYILANYIIDNLN